MSSGPESRRGVESIVLLAAAVGLLVLHALARTPFALHLRVLAALPGALACLLWWRYFALREQDRFPFLPYAVTQLYLYWGFATIALAPGSMPTLGASAWTGAILGALVVAIGLTLAFPIGRDLGDGAARALDRCLPRSAPGLSPLVLVPWLAVCALVHADVVADVVPSSGYYVVKTLGDYSPLLAAIAWRDLRGGTRSWALALCAGALSLAGLLSGMLEAAVQPVLAAAVLYVVFQRRIPWRLVVAGVVIVVVVNPAKHHYREIAWEDAERRDERAAKDPLLAAERWGEAIRAAWTEDPAERRRNTAGLASRFDELSLNALVLQATPAAVPFDRGVTWPSALLSFVPRLLFPGKPSYTELYNDRFNVTFGLQTRESTATSTGAFPLVADGYWNFGWPGILFVGLATGCVIGFFAGAFRPRSWAVAAIAVSSFVQLHANNPLALQVIGVVQRLVGLGLVIWIAWAVSRAFEQTASAVRRPLHG
jgi:hypothetical protein